MDRVSKLAGAAKARLTQQSSTSSTSSNANASLAAPQSSLPPQDNASTTGVNEGFMGPQPGTVVRDYGATSSTSEPPTSLQSSVDAGSPVPNPPSQVRSIAPASSSSNGPTATANVGRPRGATVGSSYRPSAIRQPSICIRRMGSAPSLRQAAASTQAGTLQPTQPGQPARGMPTLPEHAPLEDTASTSSSSTSTDSASGDQSNRLGRFSTKLRSKLGLRRGSQPQEADMAAAQNQLREYDPGMVDVLDTIDPEVQTLTSLTNVQNSLFVPNLGRWVNRRPTYVIRQAPSEAASLEDINKKVSAVIPEAEQEPERPRVQRVETGATLATIDSTLSDSRFAVLPHGTSLDGWTKEDKKELNDHVRHMLHSRRSKFKRSMRGFGQYVRRPLGFLVTLYATLITLFGLAWVLFLIGWINVGGRQLYILNVIDNILVALFAVVGDGLAPFRAVDTYHMIFIAHYHHFTWSRRKKEMLPELHDHNDLPSSNAPISKPVDPTDPEKQWEFTVLTPKQQARLEHHEEKFCKSHSFYKPHETETHHAFPLRLLVAIVVLLDCHSLFQIALGACTWGIYYKRRPFALTTVILCCSITCNATAGLLIWIGDRKTRKKDVVERINRQELTEEAIHKIEKKKEKESESEREDEPGSPKSKSRSSFSLTRNRPYRME